MFAAIIDSPIEANSMLNDSRYMHPTHMESFGNLDSRLACLMIEVLKLSVSALRSFLLRSSVHCTDSDSRLQRQQQSDLTDHDSFQVLQLFKVTPWVLAFYPHCCHKTST